MENREMETAMFWFSVEFYLETQWKTVALGVFREKGRIPGKLIESNLFKGLF